MRNEALKGLKVAILVTDGFEQLELERPRKALDEAGAHQPHWEYVEEMLTVAIRGRGAFALGAFNAQLKRALKADGLILRARGDRRSDTPRPPARVVAARPTSAGAPSLIR